MASNSSMIQLFKIMDLGGIIDENYTFIYIIGKSR